MILLDTHVLIWLSVGDPTLGRKARDEIDGAFHQESLAVSAISFWEVAMLAEKGRVALNSSPEAWRREMIGSGLIEFELDGQTAMRAAMLKEFHGDPADRFIAMTAINRGAHLMTADAKILAWRGELGRIDARH